MKVKILRESGLPVDNIESYLEDWKTGYDSINEEFTMNKITISEMQGKTAELDKVLKEKHGGSEIEIELPTDNDGWLKLQEKYEMPVVVAQDGNGSCVLVLMDVGTSIGG